MLVKNSTKRTYLNLTNSVNVYIAIDAEGRCQNDVELAEAKDLPLSEHSFNDLYEESRDRTFLLCEVQDYGDKISPHLAETILKPSMLDNVPARAGELQTGPSRLVASFAEDPVASASSCWGTL